MSNYVTGVFNAFVSGWNLWLGLYGTSSFPNEISLGAAFACGFVTFMCLIREVKS